ncbi:TetR/AcrR family transcriptional regulator C-terminal domain-containing protein [Nocardioides panacisoli]|uniref:TetR/AcrR family transcriptional regulator C-terminal domain-containing protein n=1 Tax=Nocardioides panacisoli TaxID=627624 RepID=UPI001C633E37|nr:TetR/AcrR family transcriptional regulator C-terminal domain-containing protein [Nocardioides panacisoli]QYJ04505.1 TetR/AcrR family transcriptional regulator C-terminal domain-containing protein [Nocardioides panacisoli]
MGHHRADVVDAAVRLLDEVGLEALTMRRLAGTLGVRPSALYHHFSGKDALLGAVADEVLDRGRRPTEVVAWQAELRLVCVELRDIMLAHRDGAALMARARSLGVGAAEPMNRMASALRWAGAEDEVARVGARTLFHYVYGHVADEQTQQQSAGDGEVGPPASLDFSVGLSMVLDGLATRMGLPAGAG